jgi:hypothetical protein
MVESSQIVSNPALCYDLGMRSHFIHRHARLLLLGAFAVTMFAIWFGLLVRVLPLRPRAVCNLGQPPMREGFPGYPSFHGFSGDNRVLLSAWRFQEINAADTDVGPVQVWDARTGKELASLALGPESRLAGFRISRTGHRIVVGAWEKDACSLRILDVVKGQQTRRIAADTMWQSWDASQDGGLLAFMQAEGRVTFVTAWDLEHDEQIMALEDHCGPVACSPDGRMLACVSLVDRTAPKITIWDIGTRKEVCSWPYDETPYDQAPFFYFHDNRSFRFALDSAHLLVSTPPGQDGSQAVSTHDVLTGTLVNNSVQRLPEDEGPTGAGTIAVMRPASRWKLETKYEADPITPGSSRWLARLMANSHMEGNWGTADLLIRESESGKVISTIPTTPVSGAIVSPDQETLVVIHGMHTDYRVIQIWDLPPRRPMLLFLALAALPTLLFTAVVWWRIR